MTTSSDLNNKINELYNEYRDDSIILQKLNNYILNELPAILINIKKLQKCRDDRKMLLQDAHDKFVKQFISKNIFT